MAGFGSIWSSAPDLSCEECLLEIFHEIDQFVHDRISSPYKHAYQKKVSRIVDLIFYTTFSCNRIMVISLHLFISIFWKLLVIIIIGRVIIYCSPNFRSMETMVICQHVFNRFSQSNPTCKDGRKENCVWFGGIGVALLRRRFSLKLALQCVCIFVHWPCIFPPLQRL